MQAQRGNRNRWMSTGVGRGAAMLVGMAMATACLAAAPAPVALHAGNGAGSAWAAAYRPASDELYGLQDASLLQRSRALAPDETGAPRPAFRQGEAWLLP